MIEIPEKCLVIFKPPTDWIHSTKFGTIISTKLWYCTITDDTILFNSRGHIKLDEWYFVGYGNTADEAFNQAMNKRKHQKELYKPIDRPKIGLSLFKGI